MKIFFNVYFVGFIILLCTSMLPSLDVRAHDAAHHGAVYSETETVKNEDFNGNPRGLQTLDFHAKHISRVVTAGYPVSFGVYAFIGRKSTQYLTMNDSQGNAHRCVKSNFLAFDVDDNYAFDINEKVSVEFLVDRSQTLSLVYGFDQHGSEKAHGIIDLNKSNITEKNLVWVKADLPNARFANRGLSNTDFVLTTNETMLSGSSLAKGTETTLVLCDVKITRASPNLKPVDSHELKVNVKAKAKVEGNDKAEVNAEVKVKIDFKFTNGANQTPVRLGLYNSNGSAVLLDEHSLVLPFYEDKAQQPSLPAFSPPYQFWPHENRYFYYVDGAFSKHLPPDTYTLIATKGPEYRISQQSFTVKAADKPFAVQVNMQRWLDLPRMGWYSGDVHIHIERTQKDNANLAKIFKAEDLHFSNLLEMSTSETNHFSQYSFGDNGTYTQDDFAIVPGIEGPRTAHRGHAIALNVKQAVNHPDSFFLYHKYFKEYQQQKAVIGYAHVGSKEFNASWGLALDMPFGLVDFVEVMQNQRLRTDFWYEFLNLGFKLAPAAGSDYPYFEQPGAVRSYVKRPSASTQLNSELSTELLTKPSTEKWYQQLKAGNTYVSNLPFIELTVNGKAMGSKLAVKDNPMLTIDAKVSINTDYDRLAQLELIHCGTVIKNLSVSKNDSGSIHFQHQFTNNESGWLALRAKGKNYALAHTGAIYLEGARGNSICRAKAPSIIDTMQARLLALKTTALDTSKELEYWETTKLEQAFIQQKDALEQRIALATRFYQSILTNHFSQPFLVNGENQTVQPN
ncbi:CehA/McbA family metallohydrolase [Colwelliaceae bacterium 6471]